MDHQVEVVAIAADAPPPISALRDGRAMSLGTMSQVPPRIVAIGRSQ